jgi:hypothetical protein
MNYTTLQENLKKSQTLRDSLAAAFKTQSPLSCCEREATVKLNKTQSAPIQLPDENAFNTLDAGQKLALEKQITDFQTTVEEAETCITKAQEMHLGKTEASAVIVVGGLLLIVIAVFYVALHLNPCSKSGTCDPSSPAVKAFFTNLGKAQAIAQNDSIRRNDIAAPLRVLKDSIPANNLFIKTFGPRLAALAGQVSANDSTILKAADQRAVYLKTEINKIHTEALSLSQNDGFFWIGGFWKWLELIFWGEFGVIICIMVWVSTEYSAGTYTKKQYSKEWRWYLTEVVVGPIVVMAAFLLFGIVISRLLEGVTASEEQIRTSIYLSIGVSFTLGFFIRRTLGVFDFIKNKLPLPSSGN